MTVIDVVLDRQRPNVVENQAIPSFVDSLSRKRKSSPETRLMQEIQGCVVGNIFAGDSKDIFSMEGNGTSVETEIENDLLRIDEDASDMSNLSSLPTKKQKMSVKTDRPPVRGRRKSRWKLKFHHQALPPEYLRHYKQQERKRRQTETKKNSQVKNKSRRIVKKSFSETDASEQSKTDSAEVATKGEETEETERLKSEKTGEEEAEEARCTGSEDLAATMTSIKGMKSISQLNIDISQNKAFLENLLSNQIEINRVEHKEHKEKKLTDVKNSLLQFNKLKNMKHEERHKSYSIPSSGKIMNYSDLPYMGEITLDGIKPRRGRKPKKADICHLIYKNYGQVFPGAPADLVKSGEPEGNKKPIKWKQEPNQNQINSSQTTKVDDRQIESPLPTVSGLINHTEVQNRIINSLLEKRLTQEMRFKGSGQKLKDEPEEPLNLCVRDLQSLKIKLSRKHGNIYETKNAEVKIKPETELEDGIKKEIEKTDSEVDSSDEEEDLAPFNLVTTELRESSDEDNFLNFNDQITLTKIKHPRKKLPNLKEMPTPQTRELNSTYWPGSNVYLHPMAVPSPLLYYQRLPTEQGPFAIKEAPDKKPKTKSSSMKRVSPKMNPNAAHVITKRKRSAIFIPPVPAENTANPTTEVSICKFKFTGGAKPSLQEKKMLSVDSGGNFRYYSGTGDKSMRGYEYFPRESLQQCQENTGCSPSGVFLTASALGSGEKIPEEIGHSGFFDADFPLQPPPIKPMEQKPKAKTKVWKKNEKKPSDVSRYSTLREHLTGTKSDSPETSVLGEEVERDDNSDNSTEGFDLQHLMQSNYFDNLKVQEESSRMSGISDDGTSRGRKSRKTRKSLAREKLEQTFKEKGFLIQTQQLESAEGATYCKFRQLRKFTRYLFRSWKDYLPGNVRDLSVDAGVDNAELPEIQDVPIKMETPDLQDKPF